MMDIQILKETIDDGIKTIELEILDSLDKEIEQTCEEVKCSEEELLVSLFAQELGWD